MNGRREEEIRRVTAELQARVEELNVLTEQLIAGLAASGSGQERQEGEEEPLGSGP